jgi:hypothetical protein
MEEKKEPKVASPVMIVVAAALVIGLFAFLYMRYFHERTISPEETRRSMMQAQEKMRQQMMARQRPGAQTNTPQ